MRLILSRKGLDSSFGSLANPILPDGRLCWLPIPEVSRNKPNLPRYSELTTCGLGVADLLASLGSRSITPDTTAHLDPDLQRDWLEGRDNWRPMFGQTGAAERHLRNEGVGPGDIFLFFGWFRQTECTKQGLRFVSAAPDLHVLYGWLLIEQRLPSDPSAHWPIHCLRHPHLLGPLYDPLDVIYTADTNLHALGRADLPGAGMFRQLRPELILTREGASRSTWRLPRDFYPGTRKPLSYNRDSKRWTEPTAEYVDVRVASRGQEFVCDLEDYPGIVTWLKQSVVGAE